jgi:membrane-associated phospholipid phosphatase
MGPAPGVSWWHFVTEAGDPGLLGPVLLAMALVLGWRYSWREAAWLALAWLLAALGVALLKLALLACGQHWMPGLESPSGHACMAVVAYGALAAIVGAGRSMRVRTTAALVAFVVIVGIAASRVVLRVHTVIEVVIGLEMGVVGMLAFVLPFRARQAQALDLRVPLVVLGLTAFASNGIHFNIEGVIRHLARRVAESCHGSAVTAPAPAPSPSPESSSWFPPIRPPG